MRSVAKAFLLFVLVLTLVLPVGAQAASGADAENCAVVRIDACVAGNQYTVFLTEPDAAPGSLGGDELYYMDQFKANASPMLVAVVLPDFTTFDAYAGGVFSNDASSPRKLGSYITSRAPVLLEEIAVIGRAHV